MAETALAKSDGVAAFEAMARLPVVRQLGLMFGLAASIALGGAVLMWSQEPTYGVLYGGLAQKDAAQVAESLQKQKISYKVDDKTGAIMVPSNKVAEIRLQLAKDGLPHSNAVGLEMLQQKQDFGTSQFIQLARYQHALEEELARSVASLSQVQSARVHLALPKQSAFIRKRQKATASVLVNLYPGRELDDGQVAAITNLVAASIPNLDPDTVTVVDQRGNLLSGKKQSPELAASQEHYDYTRRLEQGYIDRIQNILSPIVGPDGVRSEVSADMDFTVTEKTREDYNPDLPALRSEQVYEENTSSKDAGGVPGALSNEPPPAGTAPQTLNGKKGTSTTAQGSGKRLRRTTANYELDKTISHTRFASGTVKRLSVAVVIDDKVTTDKDGTVKHVPRTPEEIARITSLVREAVGYDAARGDTVNVINASFTAPEVVKPLPEPPLWKQTWVWDIGKQVLGALVVLILILGVLRPILRALATSRPAASAGGGETGGEGADQLTLSGPGGPTIGQLPKPTDGYESNLALAQDMARQDPKHVAQVVRTWVASDG